MNSKRPSISTTSPRKRALPKGNRLSAPLGHCLLCGDVVKGPAAIRLKHGAIQNKKPRVRPKGRVRVRPKGKRTTDSSNVEFVPLPFEDRSKVKWICYSCASEGFTLADEGFQFSSLLKDLSSDGQCCLCNKVIEPYPLEDWSSAILIERGFAEGSRSVFIPKESGHLHFFCMDDLNIDLWRLIQQSDEPDYHEWEATLTGG